MTEDATLAGAEIERELRIAARPETVFAFWVEPDRIVRWMGRDATIDPRPGGVFRLDYNGSDIVRGEIVEIDPPHRLVLTWGWEAEGDATPPGSSRVEVTFTPLPMVTGRSSGSATVAWSRGPWKVTRRVGTTSCPV